MTSGRVGRFLRRPNQLFDPPSDEAVNFVTVVVLGAELVVYVWVRGVDFVVAKSSVSVP